MDVGVSYIRIGLYVTQYTQKKFGSSFINSRQSLMFQYTDIILDNARSSLTEIYDMIHIFVHISVTTDIWGNIAKNLCLSASMLIYFLILALASKIESLLGPK